MFRGLLCPHRRLSSFSVDLSLSKVGGRFRGPDSLAGDGVDLIVGGLFFILVNCEAKLLPQPLREVFTWLRFWGWNSVSAFRGRPTAARGPRGWPRAWPRVRVRGSVAAVTTSLSTV